MKKQTGFTLIELIVTLAIVGIVLTVGVPSLKTFLQGNRLIASSNELLSAFHLARSEAIKLNTRVTICESSDGTKCDTTGSWKEGWIVFVDFDGNLAGTGARCSATGTDCLLRVHEGFDKDSQLIVAGLDDNNAAVSSFTFTSRGLPKLNDGTAKSGVFSLCTLDDIVGAGKTIDSRAVVLSLSGRVRISDNAAVITCP
ncbi:MAG: GspH/FimT family pseudopilin [Gammaproteobacteria bacterium]|nr:GspH/FimT family pseudopilin [Gammaproteobacteria bacterium]